MAQGRKPAVFACGVCHRADGPGGPENANIAGLPAAYIVQQMADYKSGARTTAMPDRAPQKNMIALSKAITDDEVQEAAAYFAARTPRQNVRVVETADVPVTVVAGWFLADAKTGAREPIGQRVIEVPENLEQFENRDTHSRFIAYVPPGSVARGEALAAGVPGKTDRCAICHGPDLKGLAGIPPIVGRSPSYAVRQLYEFQTGARNGAAAALMKPVVAPTSRRRHGRARRLPGVPGALAANALSATRAIATAGGPPRARRRRVHRRWCRRAAPEARGVRRRCAPDPPRTASRRWSGRRPCASANRR